MLYILRSPVAELLMSNGVSHHWLLGNKLISITTSASKPPASQHRFVFPGVSEVDSIVQQVINLKASTKTKIACKCIKMELFWKDFLYDIHHVNVIFDSSA